MAKSYNLSAFKALRAPKKKGGAGWSFKKALRMTYGDDQGRAAYRPPNRKKGGKK